MAWYTYVPAGIGVGIVLAFWGWVGISIISLFHSRIELGERLEGVRAMFGERIETQRAKVGAQLHSLETACAKSEDDHLRTERQLLEFARRLEKKVDQVGQDVARMAGRHNAED